MVAKLATGLVAIAVTSAAAGSVLQPKPRATSVQSSEAKCDCSIVPWKPDPPCSRQCTGLIIKQSTNDELKAALDLPEWTLDRVTETKTDDLTPTKVDDFLKSDAGREFMQRVETADAERVKVLAETAKRRSSGNH